MSHPAPSAETAASASDAVRLRQLLHDELAAQRDVVAHLETKRDLLRRRDAVGLGAHLAASDPLWARLEELTRRRERLVATLARRLRIPAADVTVRRVAATAPPEERAALERAARELNAVLSSVAALNRRTNALARQALELDRALVHVLLGSAPPVTGYGRDGAPVEVCAPSVRRAREL